MLDVFMHSTDVQKILFATSYFGNYHKNITSDGGNLLSYDIRIKLLENKLWI